MMTAEERIKISMTKEQIIKEIIKEDVPAKIERLIIINCMILSYLESK